MMVIFQFSDNRSASQRNFEKELSRLFFLGLKWQSFTLDIFFFFFSDFLTLRERKVLIEKELSGVNLRCQLLKYGFKLTLRLFFRNMSQNDFDTIDIQLLTLFHRSKQCQECQNNVDTDKFTDNQYFDYCGVKVSTF